MCLSSALVLVTFLIYVGNAGLRLLFLCSRQLVQQECSGTLPRGRPRGAVPGTRCSRLSIPRLPQGWLVFSGLCAVLQTFPERLPGCPGWGEGLLS